MKPQVRILCDGVLGHKARVYIVGAAGEEIELTCVTGATVTLGVGEANRASLDVVMVGGRFDAELDYLAVCHLGHSRWGRLLWAVKRWWWRTNRPEVSA